MAPSRRTATRPVRSTRSNVQTYHEESTSGDESTAQSDSNEPSLRAALSLRPRNPAQSYREESTDASLPDIVSDGASDVVLSTSADPPIPAALSFPETTPDPIASRAPRAPRARPTSKTKACTRAGPTKRPRKSNHELGKSLNKRKKVDTENMTFVSSGVIPPWQTLPYQILFDIFLRASHPLVEEKLMCRTPSVPWLVRVALLCRSFHEPALAALYYSPPLLPAYKSHALLNLLSKPQASLSMNYASKVRELHVDAETVLLYKSGPTLGYFELPKLIEKTPQLQRLRLYHRDDFAIGIPHSRIVTSKWIYPDSLFSALQGNSISLRGWDWNGRFEEPDVLLSSLLEKHLQPAFRSLRELRLLHINDLDQDQDDPSDRATTLAAALQLLPQLERLEFIECTLVDCSLLSVLPSNLRSLTLCNCIYVHSRAISSFLASHGRHLRELNLSHNRHLNISWMKGLATSCGSLERLKVDVSIHDQSTNPDMQPHFPHLICDGSLPTWPTTLQEIELIQLKNWDSTMAELFFATLIDAAPTLRDLRRLVISAILRNGWRARASFRDKWIGRLERVFLRQSKSPNPNLCSLQKRPLESGGPNAANLGHENGAVQGRPKRQSLRLIERMIAEIVESEEEELTAHAISPHPEDGSGPNTVQGMCDVVMIRIDNQRPSDTQFSEIDFLDDEMSGDEDWDGHDFEPAAGHAW